MLMHCQCNKWHGERFQMHTRGKCTADLVQLLRQWYRLLFGYHNVVIPHASQFLVSHDHCWLFGLNQLWLSLVCFVFAFELSMMIIIVHRLTTGQVGNCNGDCWFKVDIGTKGIGHWCSNLVYLNAMCVCLRLWHVKISTTRLITQIKTKLNAGFQQLFVFSVAIAIFNNFSPYGRMLVRAINKPTVCISIKQIIAFFSM